MQEDAYPVRFSVEYPDRALNRITTAFRIIVAIPIFIVLAAVSGETWQWSQEGGRQPWAQEVCSSSRRC